MPICDRFCRTAVIAALILSLVLAGCKAENNSGQDDVDDLRAEIDEMKTQEMALRARLDLLESSPLMSPEGDARVVIHFGLSTTTEILTVPVLRTAGETADLKQVALAELIAGPDPEGPLSPILPPETELLSLEVSDGLATVDFTSHIRQYAAGSAGESLVIAGIVNTLTEFPDVDRVQILVEGESGVSLGGHFTLEEPLERFSGMIPN
ncbi:MAG: GerMN domain-containing protein [Bacillota bacterium]